MRQVYVPPYCASCASRRSIRPLPSGCANRHHVRITAQVDTAKNAIVVSKAPRAATKTAHGHVGVDAIQDNCAAGQLV